MCSRTAKLGTEFITSPNVYSFNKYTSLMNEQHQVFHLVVEVQAESNQFADSSYPLISVRLL